MFQFYLIFFHHQENLTQFQPLLHPIPIIHLYFIKASPRLIRDTNLS